MGWLLCPAGQEVRGLASNAWANDSATAERVVMGALQSLRRKYGRRVQLYGNVLIGFSEGAYVGQNIGVTQMKTFNRWLIMASCDRYFGGNLPLLEQEAKAKKLKRVYLWTGELDGVVFESKAAYEHLHKLGVNVRLNIPQGFWHAIPSETMEQNFKQPLKWLLAAR
jgi:predicted esterase